MYCSNCGFKNEEGIRICANCGQELDPEVLQPDPEQVGMPLRQEEQGTLEVPAQAPPPQVSEPKVSAPAETHSGQAPTQQPGQPPAWAGQQVAPSPGQSFPNQTLSQQGGQIAPQVPDQGMPPTQAFPGQVASPPWVGQVAAPPAKKKKKKKGLVITLIIVGVLALLIAGFLVYSLPLKTDIILAGTRQTTNGNIDGLSLSVETNQWITEVRYALDPDNPEDPNAYRVLANVEGGIFSKKVNLPKLSLDKAINESSKERGPWQRSDNNAKLGNHTLYITVKTMFGTSEPQAFNLLYASGISALPDRSKIRKIEDSEIVTEALINELLVSIDMGADRSVAENLAAETGGEIVGEIPVISRYQIRYDNASEEEIADILEDLLARPEVLTAQYNYVYDRSEIQLYPNDALLDPWDIENPDGNNWGLEVIRAPLIWNDLESFTPISVGIADGGLEYDHEDLSVDRSNIFFFPTYTMESLDDIELFYAKSDKSPGSVYYDRKEHGTHVTGIISAIGNNGIGCTGVNWQTEPYFFHYWHMDVNEDTGELDLWNETTSFELEVTLTTLVEQGCRIINYSVGENVPSAPGSKHEYIETQAYGDLCLRLESLGYDFLVFKAAGNEAEDASAFEMNRIMTGTDAARRHTVIVGAIENTPIGYDEGVDERIKYAYQLSGYSNYGSIVDVAAPGTDVFSTVPNNEYVNMPGTSMASPMAAGVASLIYGAHPEYTASQVKAILKEETDTFTTDGNYLIPVVNAALASDYAKTRDLPQVPPGEIIPDPRQTPYPGPPTPNPPGQSGPVEIELPDHTPFNLEEGQGGLAGLVYDEETENPVALFSVYFTGLDGEMVTLDYAYPYPETYDAQLMGEFFTRIPAESGQEVVITNLVIEAPGYNVYEGPTISVRGGEVTSLGTIYLKRTEESAIPEPEPKPITDPKPVKPDPGDGTINIPGHTPYTPQEGKGGYTGFVYDAVTKQPLSSFRIENNSNLKGKPGGNKSYEWSDLDNCYTTSKLAKIKGEFIFWTNMFGAQTGTKQGFDIAADGYETYHVPPFTVEERAVTDLGIIYMIPVSASESSPLEPQPVKPDPGSDVINIPGHTPFCPEESECGFTGFVYDAVTKQPISSFRFEGLIWLNDEPAGVVPFDWPYPSDFYAKIEGEFIYWLYMLEKTDTVQSFDIAADGYETYHVPAFSVEERAVTDLGVIYMTPKGASQSPPLEAGQVSVTLNWGAQPADLDLHATAPLTDGAKKFHIFAHDTYASFGKAGDPDAELTSASDSGNGPENIVIFRPKKGVAYTFYVHDFTNTAKKSDAWALSKSGAEVKISIGDSPPTTLKVPNKEGTLWKVCTIKDGKISSSEDISYEGRPLNIGASE